MKSARTRLPLPLTHSKLARKGGRAGATQSEAQSLSQLLISRAPGVKVVEASAVYEAIAQLREACETMASVLNDRVVSIPSLPTLDKGKVISDPIGDLWPEASDEE